jgi:hypothetical protein
LRTTSPEMGSADATGEHIEPVERDRRRAIVTEVQI